MFKAINEGSVPAPYDTPGIAGKKVSYFFIDESGGSTKQVAEFRNMVQRQKVDVVMGYISSGDCLAIPSVATEGIAKQSPDEIYPITTSTFCLWTIFLNSATCFVEPPLSSMKK